MATAQRPRERPKSTVLGDVPTPWPENRLTTPEPKRGIRKLLARITDSTHRPTGTELQDRSSKSLHNGDRNIRTQQRLPQQNGLPGIGNGYVNHPTRLDAAHDGSSQVKDVDPSLDNDNAGQIASSSSAAGITTDPRDVFVSDAEPQHPQREREAANSSALLAVGISNFSEHLQQEGAADIARTAEHLSEQPPLDNSLKENAATAAISGQPLVGLNQDQPTSSVTQDSRTNNLSPTTIPAAESRALADQKLDKKTVHKTAIVDDDLEKQCARVKSHVWSKLGRELRGFEGLSPTIEVKTETCGSTTKTVIVECSGRSAASKPAIQRILRERNWRPALNGFALEVRETSSSSLFLASSAGGMPDELSETTAVPTQGQVEGGDVHTSHGDINVVHNIYGSDQSYSAFSPGSTSGPSKERELSTIHGDINISNNTYDSHNENPSQGSRVHASVSTFDPNREGKMSTIHGNINVVRNSYGLRTINSGPYGSGPYGSEYAYSPRWTSGSVLVECLFPKGYGKSRQTLCGALLRVQDDPAGEERDLRAWTCGGIIYVDGKPYGLATAHSLLLQRPGKNDDADKSKVKHQSSVYDDLVQDRFDEDREMSYGEDYLPVWQTLGRVSNWAMARVGQVPANNDWLLIDITKDFELPNLQPEFAGSWPLHVSTWLGPLGAERLPESSFLLFGNSPFKAMKLSVDRPIEPGESGAWVMRNDDVIGVVIAGGVEDAGNVAYAISMEDVCRSISTGMNDAIVHIPTSSENAILAHTRSHEDQDSVELAALHIEHLVQKVASEGSPAVLPSIQRESLSSNDVVGSLLQLARMCPPRRHRPLYGLADDSKDFADQSSRSRFSLSPLGSAVLDLSFSTISTISKLAKFEEMQALAGLFSAYNMDKGRASHGEIAEMIQSTMTELRISPIPRQRELALLSRSLAHARGSTRPTPSRDLAYGRNHGDMLRDLPKLVARMIFAYNIGAFFVYCGPWTEWLYRYFAPRTSIGVERIFTKRNAAAAMVAQLYAKEFSRRHHNRHSQIHAFVIGEHEGREIVNGRPRFSRYGDIVEYPELKSLLWRLSNTMAFPDDEEDERAKRAGKSSRPLFGDKIDRESIWLEDRW